MCIYWLFICPKRLCFHCLGYLGRYQGSGPLGLWFELRTVETSHWKDQVTLC